DNFLNQISTRGADTRAAEDFSRLGISQQFHEAVLAFKNERLAVIVEWVARRQIGNSTRLGCLLRQTDAGKLRVGENYFDVQPIIHFARAARDVGGGGFALLDGDMNN